MQNRLFVSRSKEKQYIYKCVEADNFGCSGISPVINVYRSKFLWRHFGANLVITGFSELRRAPHPNG